jgi:hypothetical protein
MFPTFYFFKIFVQMTKAAARVVTALEDVVTDCDVDLVQRTHEGFVEMLGLVVGVDEVVEPVYHRTLWPVC